MNMAPPLELTPAQLRALTSGVRVEIVALLSQEGARSAREIAQWFGRPVTGIYHHIEQLERAGLIRVAATRPGRRRPEKLYALVAQQMSSRTAARSKPGRTALAKVARRFLLGAARSVDAALSGDEAVTEGPGRDTTVRRVQVRLSRTALAELNAEIDALLARAQSQGGATGKGIELTFALAPSRVRHGK